MTTLAVATERLGWTCERPDYTEVLSGVDPGQRVVTSAQFLIDAESNLGDVMRSMMGQMGSGDMRDMPPPMKWPNEPSA